MSTIPFRTYQGLREFENEVRPMSTGEDRQGVAARLSQIIEIMNIILTQEDHAIDGAGELR